jgi:hypothetical protein
MKEPKYEINTRVRVDMFDSCRTWGLPDDTIFLIDSYEIEENEDAKDGEDIVYTLRLEKDNGQGYIMWEDWVSEVIE